MMLMQMWVHTPFARAAGWALFHSLWEGTIVAVLLALVLTAIHSSRGRYVAACVALLAILVGFLFTFTLGLPHERMESIPQTLHFRVPADALQARDIPPSADSGVMDRILPWTAPAWMAGILVLYLRHAASWIAAYRLQRRGVCLASEAWLERLGCLATRVRLSRPVALLESGLAEVPVVIGHWRPVILMPVGLLAGLPKSQIEAILLHELAHIRRYDYLVNILQSSIEALLFYHPLVWWISGVIRAEREHCCDDLAASVQGDPHEYAGALAALEQYRWDAPSAALAAAGGSLMKRIRRLLSPPEAPGAPLTPLFSAGILMVAAAVGLGAWGTKVPARVAPGPPRRVAFVALGQTAPAAQGQVSAYKKRLDEDVVHNITDEEKRAFRALRTDQAREEFIRKSWQTQAPIPAGPALQPPVTFVAQAQPAPQPQAQESPYSKWLSEDVAYIITDQERAAFRALQTDQERQQFIQQFWRRRDPTPGTPENEFMIEHYRRIRYADEHFGDLKGVAGWKTDRGRIYITFGPPDERDEHPATATSPANDLWRYTYLEGIGYDVNILFLDPTGTGEYHMARDPNPPPNRDRGGAQ
jgi:GWxTD domain-containing protein